MTRHMLSVATLWLVLGCAGSSEGTAASPFDLVFAHERRIPLAVEGGVIGSASAVLRWRDAIVVVDEMEANIKVFSGDGQHLRTLGRPGDGPWEFRAPVGAVVLSNDELAVLDGRHARVTLFTWPGQPDTSWSIGGYAPGGIAQLGEALAIAALLPPTDSVRPSARRPVVHRFARNGVLEGSAFPMAPPSVPFGRMFSTVRIGGNGSTVAAAMIGADSLRWRNDSSGHTQSTNIRALGLRSPDWSAEGIENIQDAMAWANEQEWLWGILLSSDDRGVLTFMRADSLAQEEYSQAVVVRRQVVARTDWNPHRFIGMLDGKFATITYRQDGQAILDLYRLAR